MVKLAQIHASRITPVKEPRPGPAGFSCKVEDHSISGPAAANAPTTRERFTILEDSPQ
jgi:hypothetical protein